MIVFDNDDDCAIPEDKIDVDHDDPSKIRKGSVQDWTDVEQVMVVLCGWHPSPLWVPFHLVPVLVVVEVFLHLLNFDSVARGDGDH